MSAKKQKSGKRVPPPAGALRMNQLMAATGLPKSTLLYYVDQGLLPKPVKTSPNMAYYHPACVRRAALIKTLQGQHRLPLGRIKKLLKASDQGQDIAPLLALNQEIFGQDLGPKMNTQEFLKASGMTRERLDQLLKAELLLPLEPGQYDQQDLAMAVIYARGRDQGLSPEDVSYYPRLGKKIVDHEMRLRDRLTRNLPPADDAQLTLAMVQSARSIRSYVIDRLFQQRVAASDDLKDRKLLGEDEGHENHS